MDQEIKTYADSLYESALMDSVQALQDAQRKGTRERASRNLGVALPMSGVDIQAILAIYNEHIERSMVARFESYERAFTEAHQTPSERDFAAILDDAKQARNSAVRISLSSLEQFIKSPTLGNVASGATEATLQNNSAPAHDRVLRRWKVWKARVRLKPSTPKAEERVKQRDALLPVYNRAEFDQDLTTFASQSSAASPLCLVFMDLDKFKSINDGPGGHEAGDRALKAFAEVLLEACRGKGSAYRYGGDELCLLLPNHSLDEACSVADRVRRGVRAIKSEELPDGLRTSVGVACVPESTADVAQLVPMADCAMYTSKNAGGNRVSRVPTSVPETTPESTNKEIKGSNAEKNAEIAALNERILQLSRKPYKEALTRIVQQLLDQMMTLEGRHVLHHLMIKEPVEVGRTIAPGIPGERQNEQLGIAMQQGVVRHQEEGQGLRRYYWVISPQFRPVLEDLLYEEGRL